MGLAEHVCGQSLTHLDVQHAPVDVRAGLVVEAGLVNLDLELLGALQVAPVVHLSSARDGMAPRLHAVEVAPGSVLHWSLPLRTAGSTSN